MQSRSAIIAAGCAVFALLLALWCVPHTVRRIESDIGARAADVVVSSEADVTLDVHHQSIVVAGAMSSVSERTLLVENLGKLAVRVFYRTVDLFLYLPRQKRARTAGRHSH